MPRRRRGAQEIYDEADTTRAAADAIKAAVTVSRLVPHLRERLDKRISDRNRKGSSPRVRGGFSERRSPSFKGMPSGSDEGPQARLLAGQPKSDERDLGSDLGDLSASRNATV